MRRQKMGLARCVAGIDWANPPEEHARFRPHRLRVLGFVLMRSRTKWQPRYTVLSVLLAVQVVSSIDKMVMSVAIPYIAVDYHLAPLGMGVVLSVFFASYSISQIPGGLLADRFGLRKVGTIALLGWAAFTAFAGAASTLPQLIIARLGAGLGEGVYPACAYKAIAVWFPLKMRATATATVLAFANVGSGLAPLIVVQIISMWGWRGVFYSLFSVGIFMPLLFWRLIGDESSGHASFTPAELMQFEEAGDVVAQGSDLRAGRLKQLLRPDVLRWFCVMFTFDFATWGFILWIPTYLVKTRGFSMIHMGEAASCRAFVGVAGSILGGWISDRYFSKHRKALIVASQLMSALSMYMTFTAKSDSTMLVWLMITGFWLLFFFPAFWSLPMNAIQRQHMGVTAGFINMAGQVAAFIAPMAMGYLVQIGHGGFQYAYILLIGCIFVSACAICIGFGRISPPAEAKVLV